MPSHVPPVAASLAAKSPDGQLERKGAKARANALVVHELVALAAGKNDLPAPVLEQVEAAGDQPVDLHVRVGKYAEGYIGVRRKEGRTDLVKGAAIPYRRPGFEVLDPLMLAVSLSGSIEELQGGLSSELDRKLTLLDALEKNSELLGWAGLQPRMPSKGFTTDIEGGGVRFIVDKIPVSIPHVGRGEAKLMIVDDEFQFTAKFAISPIGPLAAAELNASWTPAKGVTGSADVAVNFGNASGTIAATYSSAEGFKVIGTIAYRRDRFSGQITVALTDRETADQLLAGVLPPSLPGRGGESAAGGAPAGGSAPPPGPPAAKKADSVVGYGDVDFRLTDWFAGRARVVVDADGKLTVVGEIAPPAELVIMAQQPEKVRPLGRVSAKFIYGIPYLANVGVEIGVSLAAVALLGPIKLYKIVLKGQWSERDDIGAGFSIQASLNASAYAALRAAIEVSANAEVLAVEVKLGAGISAEAGIKGYAEATPVIGMREVLGPDGGKVPEYFIQGDLELAAQPVLRFVGYLFAAFDPPWPLSDYRWDWPVGDLEYPLPWNFGLNAHFDYVLGSGKFPEIEFSKADFDPAKFGTDLVNKQVPPKGSEQTDKPPTWKDGGTGAPPEASAAPGAATPPAAMSMMPPGGGGGAPPPGGGGGAPPPGGSGSGGGGSKPPPSTPPGPTPVNPPSMGTPVVGHVPKVPGALAPSGVPVHVGHEPAKRPPSLSHELAAQGQPAAPHLPPQATPHPEARHDAPAAPIKPR